jgi:hypothetical protein
VADAGLQVRLREATERATAVGAAADAWSVLVGQVQAAVEAAEADLKTAARWQSEADALRDAMVTPPLDTVVADAAAVDPGAAENRLAALLPDELRTRALARAGEAEDLATEAVDLALAGEAARTAARAQGFPFDAATAAAEQAFVRALAALRRYAGTAAADLAAATAALDRVAVLPDLSAVQQAALDAGERPEGVAAAAAEQALATAVAALTAAQRAVDDAILAALVTDPDADPLQDGDVQAAIDVRDGAAIQDPLTTARDDYDQAARAALDDWEVEVPGALWRATADVATATRTLTRLADQATRDSLLADLDAAGDALADAREDSAAQVRREIAVGVGLVAREAAVAAAGAVTADRTGQYVRGDGPGGRTPAQL